LKYKNQKKNDEVKVVNKNVCGPDKTNHKMNIQIAKKERERERNRETNKEMIRQDTQNGYSNVMFRRRER
jgi:hypothetical protein